MKRGGHARILLGLTIPGNGPVAGPAAGRPAPTRLARQWSNGRGMPTSVQSWSRDHGLDWDHAAYWLALLVCCSLFGLFAGGYVGFIEAATPAVDAPGSYAQLATSDVQWVAMVRQSGSTAGFRLGSATDRQELPGMRQRAKWLPKFRGQLTPADPVSSTHGFVRLDRSATAGE
jgi:hypothetical protein